MALLAISGVVSARALGPAARGVLALEIVVASLLSLVVTMGVTVSCRVLLVGEKPISSSSYGGLALALTGFQAVSSTVVGLLLLPLTHVRLAALEILVFSGFGASLTAGVTAVSATYAYGLFPGAGLLEVAAGAASLTVTLLLVGSSTEAVGWYLIALGLGSVVQVVGSLAILRARGYPIRPRYDGPAWSRLVRRGVPGLGLGVAQAATYRFDRYLLGVILDPLAVGLYSAAATVSETLRLLPTAVGQVLFQRVAAGTMKVAQVRRIRAAALMAVAAAAGLMALLAPRLVRMLFGQEFSGASGSLRVLLLGELAVAAFLIDSSLLVASKRIGHASRIAFTGFGAVTFLDLLLIPAIGISGAAWASVAGYSLMALWARKVHASFTPGP